MESIAGTSFGSPIKSAPPTRAGFDPRAVAPEVLFLSLPASDVCNYRCRHCHIWRQEALADPIPRERRLELLKEFSLLNPRGTVVLPGGEVTLDFDELLAVCGAARDCGLTLIVLTNGSRIGDEEALRLAESGATCVVVSLDSHRAEIHNFVRGVPSAFAEATGAIRRLADHRQRADRGFTVTVASVLFRDNLDGFGELVTLCKSLGAQHLDFQILARTFANARRDRDVFFERGFWHLPEEKALAKRKVRAWVERFADDPFVVKKPTDLPWIEAYIDDPDFRLSQSVCGSHERNLLVDAQGNVALCFNTRAILETPFVGNVRNATLEGLWVGPKAADDRAVMDRCTLNCGALNCHRRHERPGASVGAHQGAAGALPG